MAIDTEAKRLSAIHVSEPWRSLFPIPTGAVDQSERQTAAFMYSGILAGPPSAGVIAAVTFGIAHGGSMRGPGVVHIGP